MSYSVAEEKEGIEDRTETNLVNLRRVIYLTIMNALNYEEAVHKLLKVQLQEGEEVGCLFTVVFRLDFIKYSLRLSSSRWSLNVVHKNGHTQLFMGSSANGFANSIASGPIVVNKHSVSITRPSTDTRRTDYEISLVSLVPYLLLMPSHGW
jgi:hypothetical protein